MQNALPVFQAAINAGAGSVFLVKKRKKFFATNGLTEKVFRRTQ